MRSKYSSPPWLRLAAAFAPLFLFGCGPKTTKADLDPGEKHILKIASLYSSFRSAHGGRAPKDAQELKAWAKTLKSDALAQRNIDDLETTFVSPRDNQPYALVKPEAPGKRRGGPPAMVWVFEKTGVNGKRMVAGGMGNATEMDEETFRQQTGGGP